MMFELRELLEVILTPLPIALVLMAIGCCIYMLEYRRTGRATAIAGTLLVAGASSGFIGGSLLQPLEGRYAPITDPTRIVPIPRYVAVLGAGYRPAPGLPVTAALDREAVARILEGVILVRQLPGARLIVSGGSVGGNPPSAHGYARVAIALGVPSSSIIVIDTPRTTAEEIRALGERVHQARVLLVTSAAHMPRAMTYCEMFNVSAVPAPIGNLVRSGNGWSLGALVPSGRGLRETEIAWHEYLGLFLLKMEGR